MLESEGISRVVPYATDVIRVERLVPKAILIENLVISEVESTFHVCEATIRAVAAAAPLTAWLAPHEVCHEWPLEFSSNGTRPPPRH